MHMHAWELPVMAKLMCQVHFWTFNALGPSTVLQTGIHRYHNKSSNAIGKVDLKVCRKEWSEGRGITWHVSNHRSSMKLRDQLKECEDLMASQRILFVKWKTLRHLLVMLDTGVLILYSVTRHSGDVESVLIDRTLVGCINAPLDKALCLDNGIVLLYADSNKVSLVYPNQSGRRATNASMTPPTPLTLNHDNLKRPVEKISFLDLKFNHLSVKGMPDQRIKRHIITNSQKDLIAIWWKDIQDNGFQWSSLADGESDNIIVLRVKNSSKLEVYARVQTQYNPVSLSFSKHHVNLMYCIMTPCDFHYELHSLECKTDPHYAIDASLETSGNVTAFSMNNTETLLLLGCDNGNIVLYDVKKEIIKTGVAFFSPIVLASWHPAGGIVLLIGAHGEIQCVDLCLNNLQFCICNEENHVTPLVELSSYLISPTLLEYGGWGSEPRQGEGHGGCYDNFAIVFNKGPVVLLRIELGVVSKGKLGITEIMNEFLRHKQYHQAHKLIMSSTSQLTSNSLEQLTLLSLYLDHLLSLPSWNEECEKSIESVLGLYLHDEDFDGFKDDVTMYARIFFFKLLRLQKFEKAFRLATDLSAKDLFMDLHRVALQCKQTSLAELSARKAKQIVPVVQEPSVTTEVDDDSEVIVNSSILRSDSSSDDSHHETLASVNILQSQSETDNDSTIVNQFNFDYFS